MAVELRFLGGLGVVGRNCMALEDGAEILVIDAGLYFPELRAFGVDIALPDFSYLEQNAERIIGIVLTHGHEDHIGALGSLTATVSAPIYGSRLTLGLAEKRLEEANAKNKTVCIEDFDTATIGAFKVQFIPVAHSVPDSNALMITTSEGLIYHTGDFKLDPSPVDGRTTDLSVLQEAGSRGDITLLLIDSTNAEEPGRTETEVAVRPAIKEVFDRFTGRRIIASCFASHVHRVAQIVDEALQHDRKIVPVGRSMERMFEVARLLGLLQIADNDLVGRRELNRFEDGQICVLSTGSQGEPRAALSLMSRGEHKAIRLKLDDVVLMSSDAIPGNESDVGRLIDGLTRAGAEVVHAGMGKVHVSGHAKREELRDVIQAAKPLNIIPVHGEYRHMVSVKRLAHEVRPQSNVVVAEDGAILELEEGRVTKTGEFPAPYIYRANSQGTALDSSLVGARKALQAGGVVILGLKLDSRSSISVTSEQFGWLNSSMFESIKSELSSEAIRLVEHGLKNGMQPDELEAYVEARLRRLTRRLSGVAPHVVLMLDEDEA